MSAALTILIGDGGPFAGALRECEGDPLAALPADAAPAALAALAEGREATLRFVFAPSAVDEFAEIDAALADGSLGGVERLAAGLKLFAAQLQAAVNALIARGGGQIWVCDWDDAFAYHAEFPASPMLAQARASAVRSVAKEYARMGVVANTLVVQPTREMLKPGADRRDLKAFASRFRPQSMAAVAAYLTTLMRLAPPPFTGAIVSTGASVDPALLVS